MAEARISRASIFEPHAKVTISYPALHLLQNQDEQLAFAFLPEARARYEPRPLIDHEAVERNYGRNTLAATQFISRTPAPFQTPPSTTQARLPSASQLLRDMNEVVRCNSETTLEACTFTIKGDEAGEDCEGMVRIHRWTTLKPLDEAHHGTWAEYTFTVTQFDDIDCDQLWFKDLHDLIRGESDRAVRHVNMVLSDIGLDLPPPEWLRPRRPDYSALLSSMSAQPVDTATLVGVERCCCCCSSLFDIPNVEPVALPCSGRAPHLICRECLLKWCEICGGQATCPHCRRPIVEDDKHLRAVMFGESSDPPAYERDVRYSEWENFQRSCGDLDVVHAGDRKEHFTVDSKTLMAFWLQLVLSEEIEPSSSTPLHLQPVRMSESKLLTQTVASTLDELHGATLTPSDLFYTIVRDFGRRVERKILTSEMGKILNEEEKDELLTGKCSVKVEGGFEEFMRSMVSRLCVFPVVRKCNCPEAKSEAFHEHGIRSFWSG